uniref:NADH-ubiquinone oxidoreductase chain 4 n=1 Tax=Colposcenia ignota TaxID=3230277 RepID=A0AAU8G795_9HEMI
MLELIFLSFFFLVVLNMKYKVVLNLMCLTFLYCELIIFESSIYLIKLALFMLTIWLIMMMILSVNAVENSGLLLSLMLFLMFVLQLCFYSDSLFVFYLMFEMSVIPVFLIILGWGYQSSRIDAGIYMLVYTVLFSLPLLIMIMLLGEFYVCEGFLSFFFLVSAFMVKFPLFGVHLWLPRAHVEAPVYGSMILAGIMLKLGGYGLIKLTFLLGDMMMKYSYYILVYGLLSSVYLSFICLVQTDVKMLIAYSSIVHMGLVFSGIMSMSEICLSGSMFMMIGHGLCSSGLFYMVGLVYNRIHTRSMLLNKGLMHLFPGFSLTWFFMCSSNLSFPPCLSFAGEISLFSGLVGLNFNIFILVILISFVSSLYSIFLFSFTQHGCSSLMFSFSMMNSKEVFLVLLHWVPLNLLILDLKCMFV